MVMVMAMAMAMAMAIYFFMASFSSFQHGLAINLVDGPKSMSVLKEIERHFGKDIAKLDAEVLVH